VVVGVCALAAFYWLSVERPKHVKRRVWPGAVVAMVLWMSMSWGFGSYVSSLGTYTVYYGSLAAVAVLLVWFWLSSLVFLVGAELNAQLEGVRDQHHDEPTTT
jgi:membrane protein